MSVEYWNEQLIKSARDGNHSLLQKSLDQGANINAKDTCKSTALIWAAYKGHYDCIKTLIKRGANIDFQTPDRWTPLIWAARQGDHECTKILLEANANTTLKDKKGRTAYDHANGQNHHSITKLLSYFKPVSQKIEKKLEPKTHYHFVDKSTVTEITKTCPINGTMTEIFNFTAKNIILTCDKRPSQPLSFDDYIAVTKNGKDRIENAYTWLNNHPNGTPDYPFKKAVRVPQHKNMF